MRISGFARLQNDFDLYVFPTEVTHEKYMALASIRAHPWCHCNCNNNNEMFSFSFVADEVQ